MSKTFHLILRSPDQTFIHESVDSLAVMTDKGPTIVYAKHASLTATITFSIIRVLEGDLEQKYALRTGVMFINNDQNTVTILANTCDLVSTIAISTVTEYLQYVEEQLAKGKELVPIQFKYLENERLTLLEQINMLKKL